MSTDPTSKWLARFGPLAAAIVLFSLGEAAARIAIWWQYGNANYQNQQTLDYAPFLITSEDSAKYAYRPRKPVGSRVLWCGSSTAALFSAEELRGTFEVIFGHDVEVINLAQGGFNSNQELVLLALYGMQLRPDVIVTLNGINDIVGVTKTGRPGIPYLNLTIEQAVTNPTAFWLSRVFASSQLVNAIRKTGERQREAAVQADSALIRDTVELYRQNTLKMSCVAKGIGARHIAILQPYLHLRQSPPLAEQALSNNYAYRRKFMSTVMKQLDQAVGSTALPSNARYINGLTVFDQSGVTVCFTDEAHLTSEGRRILLHRVVSELSISVPASLGAPWPARTR